MRMNFIGKYKFWEEVLLVESSLQTHSLSEKIIEQRDKIQLIYNLLETAKLAMIIGSPRRAWGFFLLAKKLHKNIGV